MAVKETHKRIEFKGEKSIKISSKGTKNIGLGIQDIGSAHFSTFGFACFTNCLEQDNPIPIFISKETYLGKLIEFICSDEQAKLFDGSKRDAILTILK